MARRDDVANALRWYHAASAGLYGINDVVNRGALLRAAAFSRASAATDGSGNTVGNNVPRFATTGALIIEGARTFYLANSAAPATQTTPSLGLGTYTLWVTGSGSAAITAGTGIATGLGTATAGTPVTITVTTAGTFTVTVTGSLTQFQLEDGAFASSFFPTTTVPTTRATDILPVPLSVLGINANGAGTYLFRGSFRGDNGGQFPRVLCINDGTISNEVDVYYNSGSVTLGRFTAGVFGGGQAMASVSVGVDFRVAMTVDGAGNARATVNGGAEFSITGCATSGLTTLNTGGSTGGANSAFIQTVAVRTLPFVVSTPQLQSLSATGI